MPKNGSDHTPTTTKNCAMDDATAKRQTDAIERIMRRWLLEEANGNQGATVKPTVAPNAATNEVWRWPIRRNTDKANWEEADDCD